MVHTTPGLARHASTLDDDVQKYVPDEFSKMQLVFAVEATPRCADDAQLWMHEEVVGDDDMDTVRWNGVQEVIRSVIPMFAPEQTQRQSQRRRVQGKVSMYAFGMPLNPQPRAREGIELQFDTTVGTPPPAEDEGETKDSSMDPACATTSTCAVDGTVNTGDDAEAGGKEDSADSAASADATAGAEASAVADATAIADATEALSHQIYTVAPSVVHSNAALDKYGALQTELLLQPSTDTTNVYSLEDSLSVAVDVSRRNPKVVTVAAVVVGHDLHSNSQLDASTAFLKYVCAKYPMMVVVFALNAGTDKKALPYLTQLELNANAARSVMKLINVDEVHARCKDDHDACAEDMRATVTRFVQKLGKKTNRKLGEHCTEKDSRWNEVYRRLTWPTAL